MKNEEREISTSKFLRIFFSIKDKGRLKRQAITKDIMKKYVFGGLG